MSVVRRGLQQACPQKVAMAKCGAMDWQAKSGQTVACVSRVSVFAPAASTEAKRLLGHVTALQKRCSSFPVTACKHASRRRLRRPQRSHPAASSVRCDIPHGRPAQPRLRRGPLRSSHGLLHLPRPHSDGLVRSDRAIQLAATSDEATSSTAVTRPP